MNYLVSLDGAYMKIYIFRVLFIPPTVNIYIEIG